MVTTKTNTFVLAIVLVLALFAFGAASAGVSSYGGYGGYSSSDDITVTNNNGATVTNTVDVEAETGDNDADGGNGGSRGDGGNGGRITTGSAYADALVGNTVNSNLTVIDRCGCEGSGDITVRNHNRATVTNTVDVEAETGDNDADGGDGGGSRYSRSHYYSRGGNDGGNGGVINSGAAVAYGTVANVVNSNVTRIR